MHPANRNALAICAATVLTALVYLFPPPGPRYYPLENVWRVELIPELPSMGWYSHAAWALVLGVVGGILLWRHRRLHPTADAPNDLVLRAITGVTTLAWFGTALILAWREFGSHL